MAINKSIGRFLRPRILDRYIVKEVMSFVALAVAGLTIMLIMDTLFELMEMLINKKVAWQYIIKLLAYRLPAFLVVTFPISLLASSELAIGRLSTDGEITAMRAGGISLRRIMIPFLVAAFAISILAFLINDYIVPEANHISQNIIREVVLKKGPPNIRRNVFFRDAENRYFYINRFDEKNMIMHDIMIYEMTRERFPRTITAKKGKWVVDTWKLENGTVYNYDKEGKITYEMSFTNMDIMVKEDLKKFFENQRTPQEMSSKELKQQIDILQKAGADTKSFEVALYLKYSIPFSGLIFVLLGVPLGLRVKRGSKATGVIISIVMVLLYYILLSTTRSLGRGGILSPLLAAWSPNMVFGLLGIFIMLIAEKK
ncbi:MAG: LptF/LptG family permease [Candidatus Caldatribacteriota bacterium]|nr:LptF/LptG family permease [Candidatus Caldatribacteriota bacterium]